MDIHHLRVLVSVFRNRSFSKASAELHLSQPTISDHIRALEEELECKLFDRLARTIIPTEQAEVLYGHAVEIIERADVIKEAVGYGKETSGDLVIGASTIPGTYLVPSVAAAFKKRYPATSFEIVISDSKVITEKILRHELLMGIVGAKLANEKIEYTQLMEDELIVVASPSMVRKEAATLGELVGLPMIFREEGSGTRKEIEEILARGGVEFERIKMAGIFGSTDAVKQAVKAGLGISILSKVAVSDELKHKVLQEVKLTNMRMKRGFHIITHGKRTLPKVYRVFFDFLMTEAGNG